MVGVILLVQKRELKKLNERNFLLVTENPEMKLRTEKGYSRVELRKIYDSTIMHRTQLMQAKNDVEFKLGKLGGVEETPELVELMGKIEAVQKLQEKKRLFEQLENVKRDLRQNDVEMRELENAIPEVLRKNSRGGRK